MVQRYEYYDDPVYGGIEENEDGNYVEYEDYQKLETKVKDYEEDLIYMSKIFREDFDSYNEELPERKCLTKRTKELIRTQENTPTKYCLMEDEKEGICNYEDMETCMEDLNGNKIQGVCMASYEITFNCEERNSDIFGH